MAQQRDEFSAFDDSIGPMALPAEGDSPKGTEGIPAEVERLRKERNEAQDSRDLAIRNMLEGARPAMQQEAVPVLKPDENYELSGLPEDTDPDVANLLGSVLSVERQKIREEFETRYGPALTRVEREQSLDEIDAAVPGFKQELMAEVETMFRELPKHEQAKYDNQLGIEVLASRVKMRRLQGGIQTGATDMATGAPSRNSGGRAQSGGVTSDDIWALSDDDFDTALEHVRMRGGG